jgi:hypothetical protein
MSEIRKWLEGIGLGEYGDAFEANKIDMDLLGKSMIRFLRTSACRLQAIGCASSRLTNLLVAQKDNITATTGITTAGYSEPWLLCIVAA